MVGTETEGRGDRLPPWIAHSKPRIDADDLAAVEDVLRSGWIAQGEQVRAFEQELASHVGQRDGVAVSSGTAGLHLALLALGVGPGSAVAMPDYTCVALVHAARAAGAAPLLVDVEPAGCNLDPEDLRNRVRASASPVRAVVVPHMFGRLCDLGAVRDAVGPDVRIVEDAAQALGDPGLGGGDALVCSFYATKMMTTGEGGMVLSGDAALLEDVRDRREYDEKSGDRARFNYKMTDVQGALGRSQLRKLPGFLERRRALSRRYGREERTCYRFLVEARDVPAALERFEARRIRARRPVHAPLDAHLASQGPFPNAARAMATLVSVPIYPALTDGEASRIVDALEDLGYGPGTPP